MGKTTVSHRLDDDLLAWATSYAKVRGSTRTVVIEEGLRSLKADSEGGVPDLPVAEAPKPVAARPSTSVFADAKGSRQQRLNASMLRSRSRS